MKRWSGVRKGRKRKAPLRTGSSTLLGAPHLLPAPIPLAGRLPLALGGLLLALLLRHGGGDGGGGRLLLLLRGGDELRRGAHAADGLGQRVGGSGRGRRRPARLARGGGLAGRRLRG